MSSVLLCKFIQSNKAENSDFIIDEGKCAGLIILCISISNQINKKEKKSIITKRHGSYLQNDCPGHRVTDAVISYLIYADAMTYADGTQIALNDEIERKTYLEASSFSV